MCSIMMDLNSHKEVQSVVSVSHEESEHMCQALLAHRILTIFVIVLGR